MRFTSYCFCVLVIYEGVMLRSAFPLGHFPKPAPQVLIELNEGEELVEFVLHEGILGGKELLLLLEHFVIGGSASHVPF